MSGEKSTAEKKLTTKARMKLIVMVSIINFSFLGAGIPGRVYIKEAKLRIIEVSPSMQH
jgi:hypothetical protein